MNSETGTASRLTGEGLVGYRFIEGIAYRSDSGELYGIDPINREIISINPVTGQNVPVAGSGYTQASRIAFNSVNHLIYGFDNLTEQLFTINPANSAREVLTTLKDPDIGALAIDSTTQTIYGIDQFIDGDQNDHLVLINPSTGQITDRGATGFRNIISITFNQSDGKVYGIDKYSAQLIRINPLNGAGVALGGLFPFNDVQGIAYNPVQNKLYGLDTQTARLLDLTVPDGAREITSLGYVDVRGLTWDPTSAGIIWAADNRTDKLLRIDSLTGQGIPIGTFRNVNSPSEIFYGVYSLAVGGGALYAINETTPAKLLRINRATAEATVIGFLGSYFGVRSLAYIEGTGDEDLYAVDGSGNLLRINKQTAVVSTVGNVGAGNFPVLGLTAAAGTLYGSTGTKIIQINRATGAAQDLVALGFPAVYGMAYGGGLLYGVNTDVNGSQMVTIDYLSGQGSILGALGSYRIEGLAFNSTANIYYASDTEVNGSYNHLIRIDGVTGRAETIGEIIGYGSVKGLAFNSATQTLYGTDTFTHKIIRIDTNTAQATPLPGSCSTVFQDVAGLAYDSNSNQLFGSDKSSGKLVRFSTTTGCGTVVGSLGSNSIDGLEYDPVSRLLYGTDSLTMRFILIDPNTALHLDLDSTGYQIKGLAGRLP